MQHHGFYEEGPSTQSSILWTQRNAVMGSFYVPWVGPDKCRVWILICLLVAAVLVCFIYIPVVTCSANDDGGVCAPQVSPQELPGLYTVDVSMLRGCPCNASTVIRSLSNARTLSNTIFANGDVPPLLELRGLSALTVTILQFVLNDIALSRWDGSTYYELPVPLGDPFFATPVNITLGNWATSPDGAGCPNPVTYTTSFIDLSNVYGVNATFLALYLRSGEGGRLLVDPDGPLLPYAFTGAPFLMADPRDGYTADLAALHTLLVLNHNSWAQRVAALHAEWDDDQLFWKARQLNVAEWQHVLYHEWLPALLGTLAPPRVSALSTYDITLASAVRVEVATVIIPAFVDTLTPAAYGSTTWGAQHGVETAATLLQTAGTVGTFLTSVINTPAFAFDARTINGRRNLYYNDTEPEDLVAEHVQRARILRVPDWAAIYTCFGTIPVAGDPRDAYEGFLEEIIYPGTSTGLTGSAVLASEFARLRDADPMFYSFRRKQIGQIFWDDILEGTMAGILTRSLGLSFPVLKSRNVFFVAVPGTDADGRR